MDLDATLLSALPVLSDIDDINNWTQEVKQKVTDLHSGTDPLITVSSRPNASDDDKKRFALALYLADQMCYPHIPDQAEFERLAFVYNQFPSGFKLYFARLKDGTFAPVGYTGWYAIDGGVFDKMHDAPDQIVHRGTMKPVPFVEGDATYVYLFNYSIIPQFYKSPQSGAMIRELAQTLSAIPRKGMSAVTVSQSGKNVAIKFGLYPTGMMVHDGEAESVYCLRY